VILRLRFSVRLAAGAGALLVLLFVGMTGHPAGQQVVYEAASLACLGLIALGLRRNLRSRSWVWLALALGVGCEVAGDFAAGAPSIPNPNWLAHGLYLAGFPFFAGGLIASMRPRRLSAEGSLPQLLDSAIVFVAGFAVLWFVRVDSQFDLPASASRQRVLEVVYPLLDWLIVALLLRFLFAPGRWPVALRLLLAATGTMFATDLFWRGAFLRGTSSSHVVVGVASLISYLFWGLAALHPSACEVEGFSPVSATEAVWHRRRIVLLFAASLVPAALLLTHELGGKAGGRDDIALLLLVVAGVPTLSVARLADLLRTLRHSGDETRNARADLQAVIDASPVPICVTDHEASVLVWNRAAERTSGYAAEEVLGAPPPIVPAEDPERVAALYQAALAGEVQRGIEIKLLDREERPLDIRFSTAPLGNGQRGVVVLFEDVTESKRAAEKIEFLAGHDPLTKLPNRRSFEREFAQAIARAARGGQATLLLCDIDNFKFINDTGGHPIGDRFLVEVANRFRSELRPGDGLARLSGDEFAIVISGSEEAEAAAVAERLLDAMREYRIESRAGVLDITVSLGLYQLRTDETAERAMRRADEALYEAKAHGKNQLRSWRPGSVAVLSASRGWSPRIKDALRDDRFEAFLQPIVTLPSEGIAYYEVLCRLRRTDGTYIQPNAFLDHAERLGLMPAIDRRMLDHAHRLVSEDESLKILVNLSASSFDDDQLLAHLQTIVAAARPGSLGIEITEHAALTDLNRAATELNTLKSLGALIAIDDFGVGFTSFEHLRRVPADLVKVGNGFIDGLGSDPVTDAILDGIVATAHALSMRVVAEGVETREVAALLQVRKIEYAQGFLYGRPLPALKRKVA
jgi:diguanylate cyclase (GGDEF)-like protein/PAS domain S-box-containing protein